MHENFIPNTGTPLEVSKPYDNQLQTHKSAVSMSQFLETINKIDQGIPKIMHDDHHIDEPIFGN